MHADATVGSKFQNSNYRFIERELRHNPLSHNRTKEKKPRGRSMVLIIDFIIQ